MNSEKWKVKSEKWKIKSEKLKVIRIGKEWTLNLFHVEH